MSETKARKPFWKRWWFWVIVVIIVGAAAAGAGGGSDNSKEASTTPKTESKSSEPKKEQPKQKEEAKTAKIGDTLKVGKVEFVVSKKSTANKVGPEMLEKKANGTFLILDVSVKNNDKESITTDSSFFKLKANGKTYEADGEATIYANDNNNFLAQDVNPDVTVKGKIVFDVPADVAKSNDLKLQVQTGFWGTQKGTIELK